MARGISAAADVQSSTADGRLLNNIWDEWRDIVAQYNATRQPLLAALSFNVSELVESVVTGQRVRPERATEYGAPQSHRSRVNADVYGYDLGWYDIRKGYTHRYLQTVTAAQLAEEVDEVLQGFNDTQYDLIMSQLFTKTNRQAFTEDSNGVVTKTAIPVYSLFNGTDGQVPPPVGATTFSANHSHLRTSGAVGLDSQDIDDLVSNITEHGHTVQSGSTIVVLVNAVEAKAIRSWRANQANANGAVSTGDFIPAQGQPGLITSNNVFGAAQVGGSFLGLTVIGSYNGALIIEEPQIPAGYVVAFASGGASVKGNVVGFREHTNPALRGLLLSAGDNNAIPLINSTWERAMGTGIRQRGAAAILQVTASATYTPPAAFLTPVSS